MHPDLLSRLTRLPLDAFLAADTPESLLIAAYGPEALVAHACSGGVHFAIVRFNGQMFALVFAEDASCEADWALAQVRPLIAHEALYSPHAVGATPIDLIESLVCNPLAEDVPEAWPSGHLLRLLLGTLPANQAEDLMVWIGLGWPHVVDLLDMQTRLATSAR